MASWFWWIFPTERERELTAQLADEEARHDLTRRQLAVSRAECESLEAVIARDRARVAAESAAYARDRAESEGTK